MTRKEIAKDFFTKVVLPVFLAWLLFAMFMPVFTKDGVTNYFMCGSSAVSRSAFGVCACGLSLAGLTSAARWAYGR